MDNLDTLEDEPVRDSEKGNDYDTDTDKNLQSHITVFGNNVRIAHNNIEKPEDVQDENSKDSDKGERTLQIKNEDDINLEDYDEEISNDIDNTSLEKEMLSNDRKEVENSDGTELEKELLSIGSVSDNGKDQFKTQHETENHHQPSDKEFNGKSKDVKMFVDGAESQTVNVKTINDMNNSANGIKFEKSKFANQNTHLESHLQKNTNLEAENNLNFTIIKHAEVNIYILNVLE